MSTSFTKFSVIHNRKKDSDHLRLGQRFCNSYIKGSWPELYYTSDDKFAEKLIEDWLTANQYTETLPQYLPERY